MANAPAPPPAQGGSPAGIVGSATMTPAKENTDARKSFRAGMKSIASWIGWIFAAVILISFGYWAFSDGTPPRGQTGTQPGATAPQAVQPARSIGQEILVTAPGGRWSSEISLVPGKCTTVPPDPRISTESLGLDGVWRTQANGVPGVALRLRSKTSADVDVRIVRGHDC